MLLVCTIPFENVNTVLPVMYNDVLITVVEYKWPQPSPSKSFCIFADKHTYDAMCARKTHTIYTLRHGKNPYWIRISFTFTLKVILYFWWQVHAVHVPFLLNNSTFTDMCTLIHVYISCKKGFTVHWWGDCTYITYEHSSSLSSNSPQKCFTVRKSTPSLTLDNSHFCRWAHPLYVRRVCTITFE